MIAHIGGLPVEELSTLALGGTAGWTLLYLFGRLGELAERVTAPREAPVSTAAPVAVTNRTAPEGAAVDDSWRVCRT